MALQFEAFCFCVSFIYIINSVFFNLIQSEVLLMEFSYKSLFDVFRIQRTIFKRIGDLCHILNFQRNFFWLVRSTNSFGLVHSSIWRMFFDRLLFCWLMWLIFNNLAMFDWTNNDYCFQWTWKHIHPICKIVNDLWNSKQMNLNQSCFPS